MANTRGELLLKETGMGWLTLFVVSGRAFAPAAFARTWNFGLLFDG